ncbi:MAG: HAD family hydrolase [Candidatus Aenigmatarchaeota archaeon]
MIKGVICDFDQTLVDSSRIHLKSFLLPLKKRGINVKYEDVKIKFGKFDYLIFRELAPYFSEQEINEMIDERKQILLNEAFRTKKMPYAEELLKFLKNKTKIGLVTGTYKDVVYKTLKLFGWEKYFDAVVTREEVKKSRPDPEILNLVLKKLNIMPYEAIYIGDSIYDVLCSKNSNVKIIALGNFKDADYKARNLREVKNILEELLP